MERTEQQKQEIRDLYAVRRKRQLMMVGTLVALILVYYGLRWSGIDADVYTKPLVFSLIAFVVGASAFSFSNWRCPACNGYLGRSLGHFFCPKCGVELR